MMRTRWPTSNRAWGFTLVELLSVVGIIVLLLALIVPAVTSINKSRALNSAGSLLVGLLSTARSEAITRRTVVRLEVATTWPDPAFNYRKITLTTATLNTAGNAYNYQQLGKWETLADGVVFETSDPLATPPTDGSVYLLVSSGSMPLGDEGQLTFAGQTVTTAYVAFSPTGALLEKQPPANLPVPIRMRLVEGTANAAGNITYTHRVNGGPGTYPAPNWFDLRINHLFGRVEVGRPESPLP